MTPQVTSLLSLALQKSRLYSRASIVHSTYAVRDSVERTLPNTAMNLVLKTSYSFDHSINLIFIMQEMQYK